MTRNDDVVQSRKDPIVRFQPRCRAECWSGQNKTGTGPITNRYKQCVPAREACPKFVFKLFVQVWSDPATRRGNEGSVYFSLRGVAGISSQVFRHTYDAQEGREDRRSCRILRVDLK